MEYNKNKQSLRQNIADGEYGNIYSDLDLNRLKHQMNNPYAIGGKDQAITLGGKVVAPFDYGTVDLHGSRQLGEHGGYTKGLGLNIDLPAEIILQGSVDKSGDSKRKYPDTRKISLYTPETKQGIGGSVSRVSSKMSGHPRHTVDAATLRYTNDKYLLEGSMDQSKLGGHKYDKGKSIKGEYKFNDNASAGLNATQRRDSDPQYGAYFKMKY